VVAVEVASTAEVALTWQAGASVVVAIMEVVTIAAVGAEVWRLAQSLAQQSVQGMLVIMAMVVIALPIVRIPTLTPMAVRLGMTGIVFSDTARTTLPPGPISVTTDSVILVLNGSPQQKLRLRNATWGFCNLQ
jgi:hypothetical protein